MTSDLLLRGPAVFGWLDALVVGFETASLETEDICFWIQLNARSVVEFQPVPFDFKINDAHFLTNQALIRGFGRNCNVDSKAHATCTRVGNSCEAFVS